MAIYHMTAKTVSRSSASAGRAKAGHDYIEREGRYKADSAEVAYSQSGNMPPWAQDSPGEYWKAADLHERGNGRLYKQVEFALPRELTAEQQKELAVAYVEKLTATKDGQLPYSLAIHKGAERGNPHCHVMISERALDGIARTPETWFKRASKNPEQGGAKKSLELRPKEWLMDARKEWSHQANAALARAGHDARIDHRNLQEQGIDRIPSKHLGPAAAAMERKGIVTRRISIAQGMDAARQRYEAEKARRAAEAERTREQERQRQREQERQAALEQARKQQQEKQSKGMSR